MLQVVCIEAQFMVVHSDSGHSLVGVELLFELHISNSQTVRLSIQVAREYQSRTPHL